MVRAGLTPCPCRTSPLDQPPLALTRLTPVAKLGRYVETGPRLRVEPSPSSCRNVRCSAVGLAARPHRGWTQGDHVVSAGNVAFVLIEDPLPVLVPHEIDPRTRSVWVPIIRADLETHALREVRPTARRRGARRIRINHGDAGSAARLRDRGEERRRSGGHRKTVMRSGIRRHGRSWTSPLPALDFLAVPPMDLPSDSAIGQTRVHRKPLQWTGRTVAGPTRMSNTPSDACG